jgi:hypothetical protein
MITALPWQEFAQIIRKIDISNHVCVAIPDDFFENLPQLDDLLARGNDLTTLPPSIAQSRITFPIFLICSINSSVPAVPFPTFHACCIVELPHQLPTFPHIESLNLSRNQLAAFPIISPRIQYQAFSAITCGPMTKARKHSSDDKNGFLAASLHNV